MMLARLLGLAIVALCLMGAAGDGSTMSLDSLPGGVSVVLLLEVRYRQRADKATTDERLVRIERQLGFNNASPTAQSAG